MVNPELIKEFLSLTTIALIGASQNEKRFGNNVYKSLKKSTFKVYPVNPKYNIINNDICYADISSIPEKIEGAIILTSPSNSEKVINDIIYSNIKYLWIQQGCDSPKTLELAKANNINVIYNKCILMFVEPVVGFHKFHRTVIKFFGKLYS